MKTINEIDTSANGTKMNKFCNVNFMNLFNNAMIPMAKAGKGGRKAISYKPYPYDYNRFAVNFGKRTDLLADRLQLWLNIHGRDGKPLSMIAFAQYLNSFSRRTNITFALPTLYQYLNAKCSPKIDRCYALAMAMGVPVQWLMGYGPRKTTFGVDRSKLDAILAELDAHKRARTRRATDARIRRKNNPGQEAA